MMKKILFTLILLVTAIAAKAVTATVYVQADEAPYLYGWFTVGGKETKINGAWPGKQMTEKVTKTNKNNEEIEFWCQTFDYEGTSSFNIIFNNGNTAMMQQTGNISDIASDRYFTYDGKTKYTDITEDFGVAIPDVEIQSVALVSDLNNWDGLAQIFTEVEPNAKYTYTLDLTEEQLESIEYYYRFKFIVNSSEYLGYDTEGFTIVDPNKWIEQDLTQGGGTNFGISFEEETMPHAILFTMEFAGGKEINKGWTLSVEATESTYARTPTFERVDNTLIISSKTDNAIIYYTTDGTTPTKSSTLYTEPITMTQNCTVKAIAVAEGYNNSEVATYEVDWFKVADVTFAFKSQHLVMATETADATIHYTIDDTEFTVYDIAAGRGEKYEAPLSLTTDCTVLAIAQREGYSPSDVATHHFVIADVTVAAPTIDMEDNMVTIDCVTDNVAIYYTLDGSEPTVESNLYEAPIPVSTNVTVKAIAVHADLLPSAVSSYTVGFRVADVEFVRNGNEVTLSTSTEGAAIFYTQDGSTPTKSSTLYAGPITMTRNCTIKAIGVADGYNDSEITEYVVDWFKVSDVTFAFKGQHLELTTETADATIYYTTDKTMPTVENLETDCTKYEAPVSLTNDCMVLAIAVRDGYHPSDVTMHNFVVADVTVAKPTFSKEGNVVTIATVTKDATIYYTLDGSEPTTESTPYPEGGITMSSNVTIKAFAVHPDLFASAVSEYVYSDLTTAAPEFASNGNVLTISAEGAEHIYYALEDGDYTEYMVPVTLTDNRTVSAYATRNGYNNSDVTTFTPDWFACADIKTRYDGRRLFLSSTEGATIYYTLDGTEPTTESATYDGEIAVGGMMTVKAMAAKQYLNNSEVLTYDIPGYYEGDADGTVTVRTPGQLSLLFAWMDKTPEKLTINGTLNLDDLRFLRAMNGLRHLNMKNVTMTDGRLPDAAFANMEVVSIELPAVLSGIGSNLFTGCTSLAAIIWNSNIALTEAAANGLNNPNLLLYVNRSTLAPESIGNVIVGDIPASIVLTDVEGGGNFYCPRTFTASSISYTRDFTLESAQNGGCAGWESIALPFTVQTVTHEENGMLVPFSIFTDSETTKPFWLFRMGESGNLFQETDKIEANTPYILCMPNHESYADNYNQRGLVTFSASNVAVAKTQLKTIQRSSMGITMVPCYENVSQTDGLYVLNKEAVNGKAPGSVFVDGLRSITPFEAYIMSDQIQPGRMIPLFDEGDTAIQEMNFTFVNTQTVKVYNLSGTMVTSGNSSEVMKNLSKGMYIVNGRKVIIK